MAPQFPSPRRRTWSGNMSRRRGVLLALMLGVIGCGPPEIEYIHVTEGSNGFVAMSKVEYQEATAPAEPRQLEASPDNAAPTLPDSLQQPAQSEQNLAVPPAVTSELEAMGPALESTLSGLPQSALSGEPLPPEASPEMLEPRVVPLQTSVKPAPDQVSEPRPASTDPALDDKLLAYRTQSRVSAVGLDDNELRAVNKPSNPQPELSSAADRAARRVAAGSRLVERGATLSGRQEFVGALQVIAEALDQQRHTNAHARALSAGLTALEEARDFATASPQQRLPLGDLILGHQTPVLQDVALDQLSNQDALQSYLNYAKQQLSTAGGDLLPGADALFALGKLHLLESQQPSNAAPRLELERAIMLFHAALVIEPKHSLAANEAGVALARLGRLNEAKLALQHSASLTAHPSTWKNLASVHQSLGEGQLAQLAERESAEAKNRWEARTQATGQLAQGTVQVVDNGTFAQAAPVNTFDSGANRSQQPLANAPAAGPAAGNNAAPAEQQQPTLADPQVRYAPRQPWGAAQTPAPRTATPPQYGAGQFR